MTTVVTDQGRQRYLSRCIEESNVGIHQRAIGKNEIVAEGGITARFIEQALTFFPGLIAEIVKRRNAPNLAEQTRLVETRVACQRKPTKVPTIETQTLLGMGADSNGKTFAIATGKSQSIDDDVPHLSNIFTSASSLRSRQSKTKLEAKRFSIQWPERHRNSVSASHSFGSNARQWLSSSPFSQSMKPSQICRQSNSHLSSRSNVCVGQTVDGRRIDLRSLRRSSIRMSRSCARTKDQTSTSWNSCRNKCPDRLLMDEISRRYR